MYRNSQKYYDDIYAAQGKDYPAEAKIAHGLIQKHKKSTGNRLLDIACGTGIHANLLSRRYRVEGLDLDDKMLAIARKNFPKIEFHRGNMLDFNMSRKFDVVVCLFSAIGYVRTKTNLAKTVENMSRHLLSGGVLLIEPWFTPDQWHPGRVYIHQVDKPDRKIVRMSRSSKKGTISIVEFEYLIGMPKEIRRESETLELGLFTKKQYLDAFHLAGLTASHDPKGLNGRGLYIGVKP